MEDVEKARRRIAVLDHFERDDLDFLDRLPLGMRLERASDLFERALDGFFFVLRKLRLFGARDSRREPERERDRARSETSSHFGSPESSSRKAASGSKISSRARAPTAKSPWP